MTAQALAPQPSPRPAAHARVVRVTPDHLEALAEIIGLAWNPEATAASVGAARQAAAALNPHGARIDIPTFLFLDGDRPLGHLTTIPTWIWLNGAETKAHWLKGLWVVPEHRNGPIGYFLVREALQHLDIALSTVVQPAPRKLFHSLGLTDLGAIPNFVRVLRPTRMLQLLDPAAVGFSSPWIRRAGRITRLPGFSHALGAALGAAMRAWTAPQPAQRGIGTLAPEQLAPEATDQLWQRCRHGIRAAALRNAAQLRAQYATKPGDYLAAAAHDGGQQLAGLAIVRRPREQGDPRLGGIRVATLSELIFPVGQPELGLALLAGAEQLALGMNADALLCSASHASLPPLLRRRGYVRLGGNVHFMLRVPGFDAGAVGLPDWWLTRGDGEADTVF